MATKRVLSSIQISQVKDNSVRGALDAIVVDLESLRDLTETIQFVNSSWRKRVSGGILEPIDIVFEQDVAIDGETNPGRINNKRFLTITGQHALYPSIQLVKKQATAGGILGYIEFTNIHNTINTNQVSATIQAEVRGATANNRGGMLNFLTKPNAGSLISTFKITDTGDAGITVGDISTTATIGFLHISTCNGVPTGVPADELTAVGAPPIVYDYANSRLYIWNISTNSWDFVS